MMKIKKLYCKIDTSKLKKTLNFKCIFFFIFIKNIY